MRLKRNEANAMTREFVAAVRKQQTQDREGIVLEPSDPIPEIPLWRFMAGALVIAGVSLGWLYGLFAWGLR